MMALSTMWRCSVVVETPKASEREEEPSEARWGHLSGPLSPLLMLMKAPADRGDEPSLPKPSERLSTGLGVESHRHHCDFLSQTVLEV